MAQKKPQVSGFSGRTIGKMLQNSGKPGAAATPKAKGSKKKGK